MGSSMHEGARCRGGLVAVVSQAEIRQAIAGGELVLHYQPILELQGCAAVGAEALLRWNHRTGGLLAPDDFLPAVAQTPVITEVTNWVLDAACAAAAGWAFGRVSVNVSARDLSREDFSDQVLGALSRAGLATSRLVVELTETALLTDLSRAAAHLERLRGAGALVALDDFGTGYSSMLYLRDLPIDMIKIDREFIAGLEGPGDDQAIVSALLELARAVGVRVVAEGVENLAQVALLRQLGCPLAQGYLFSRPVPGAELDLAGPFTGSPQPAEVPCSSVGEPASFARALLERGASLHTIAAALNAAGSRTDKASRWHPVSVARLIGQTKGTPAPDGSR